MAPAEGVLERTDFARFGLQPAIRDRPVKEWHHFIIHGQSHRVIVNFSVCDDVTVRSGGPERAVAGRVIVLVESEPWNGAVVRVDDSEVSLSADGLHMRLGRSELRLRDGSYEVSLHLPEAGIAGRLAFLPLTHPLVAGNHGLGPSGRLSWLSIPRLAAHGWLTVGAERLSFRSELAYHDHNWGRFRWGEDFGWEWGSALPADPANPWAVVYSRTTDRARLRAFSQGMYVWHHGEMVALFREATTEVTFSGLLRADPRLTLPDAMRFLTPGRASDIPSELVVVGRRGADHVELRFIPQAYVRLAIPSETDIHQVVTLNEISGRIAAIGVIGGRSLAIEGTGVFELLN